MTYESKNPDPGGCPDTVIGECEAVCARCLRDMHDELLELRAIKQRATLVTGDDQPVLSGGPSPAQAAKTARYILTGKP